MNIQTVLFAVEVLVYLCIAVILFTCTSTDNSPLTAKIRKNSKKALSICGILSILITVLGTTAIDLSGYKYSGVFNVIACAAAFLVCGLKEEKHKDLKAFLARSFVVCIAAEVFVFNFNSSHLFGDYTEKTLDLSTAVAQNYDAVSNTNMTEGYSTIEFIGINMPVGTLSVDCTSSTKRSVKFSIDITDDTNSASYRSNIAAMEALNDYTRTQTIPCNFSGNVHDLKLSFAADAGEVITVRSVTVNKPIMLHFSLIRFLMMFLGSIFVFALRRKEMLYCDYEKRRKSVKVIASCFTLVLMGFSLYLTMAGKITDNGTWSLKDDFRMTTGNQISQEIVDAFENGSVELNEKPGQDILSVENPYDWSQRNCYYLWDHLLYNGKYYSYYGIGPVLALFLPYHMITGFYFPSCWAVWLFGVIGILFLTKAYLAFADRFFGKTAASLVLLGLMIMQMSTGIYFCYFHANFYEIAQASGFITTTAGAFFLITSNVIGEGKVKNWRIALSTFCLGMGVLCRPTLAVYCIASLFFIYAGMKKKLAEKKDKGIVVPYLLCALLPYVVLGSVQVWYNYARFGNPLDFGIQYSLTINDFTKAQYHTHLVLIGFFNYLLSFPSFAENFPFFTADYAKTFQPNGYYFIATGASLGLLWRALPILGYGQAVRSYKLSDNKNKRFYALLIFAVCIACPFAIIFSIWESGFGTRYCVDFAWQIILGALVISFIIWRRSQENTKVHLNTLMIASAGISLVMNFIQIFTYENPLEQYNTMWQQDIVAFARLFEFWK